MYERFFELKRCPFASTPDTSGYYPAPHHEETLALLKYCVKEGDGIGVLVGPPGTGKTLLCHLVLDTLSSTQSVVLITNTHMASVHSMPQAIAYDLNLPFEGTGEQELRLRLTDFLMERFVAGGRTIIFVDEAHHLTTDQLEELRMLTNLEGKEEKAVQVLIVGQNRLLETLDDPQLEAFRQRIAVVAKLTSLEPEQTVEYVRARIAAAGGSADSIFTANALSEICEQSRGIPRRINQLCHRALLLAFANESGTIDGPFVEAAASQLFTIEQSATETAHHASPEALKAHARKVVDEPLLPSVAPSVVEVGAGVDRARPRIEPLAAPPVATAEPQRTDKVRGVSRLRHSILVECEPPHRRRSS